MRSDMAAFMAKNAAMANAAGVRGKDGRKKRTSRRASHVEHADAPVLGGEEEKQPCLSEEQRSEQVRRRRTFGIISHPDAGKTTLTEKLLLYGGAIHEAGTVKARSSQRHATSDWMEIEKSRGISITSTAMTFEYKGIQLNLLDTPGHQDFSEDTYRTLSAVDNALMLVDAAKGLEPQTRKLFEVCKMRELPIFTFINKMDRPALSPLELCDQIEQEFGMGTYPINWPVGSGDRFVGVYHRPTKKVALFDKGGAATRSKGTKMSMVDAYGPEIEALVDADILQQFQEELELLEELGSTLDMEEVHRGQLTPVYFGSAMNNFGVELFLNSFIDIALPPGVTCTEDGIPVDPADADFSGIIFKLQANMDPKHRDKVAFIRVRSGHFQKGMKVKVARSGKTVALSRPQKMFAQDRSTVMEGFSGDVIGLNNPGSFAIGDTVYTGKVKHFQRLPSFSPELFAFLKNTSLSKRKQFQKGMELLLGEGAVQVMYSMDEFKADPILAAIGQLQFEVVQARLLQEYGVETTLEPLPFQLARWVDGGWVAVEQAGRLFNCELVKDQWNRPVLLFRNQWGLEQLEKDVDIGPLLAYSMPPREA
mmetsp:Transcript_9572/g.33954  ORF Transcript_9572/g.33954 Transcript_9572/m.33954 type:complete len:593 (-) Transcript_9572:243-2021(-)